MLQAIRDKTTGIIAWLIIGLLVVVFSLWGIESYLRNETTIYAAKVNDVEISVQDFRFGLRQQANRLQMMYGSQFDRSMINSAEFKEGVLNGLVEQEVLVQAAGEAGMVISDGFLRAQIHGMKEFQNEQGEFDPEKYQRLLDSQGIPATLFEREMRRQLLVSQLASSVSGTAIVTDPTIDQGLRLQGQTRDVQYVSLAVAPRIASIPVTEEEIGAFYEENKSRFVEPEQIQLAYLDLNLDDIATSVEVTDDEVRALYEQQKASLVSDEQRRARHILIKLDADADESTQLAAEAKARQLIDQLKSGADFVELAKQESDDPGSASQGGDLGFFGRGVMVPEFEEAVFAMGENEITDEPVRSSFGLHVIQVTGIQAGEIPAFDEVKDKLKKQAQRTAAEDQFYELSELLGTHSFESPDTLSVAAEQTGLEIKTSDWFPKTGGSGIAAYPNVTAAAFSEDVLDERNNSQMLELSPTRVVVVRVKEHKAAEQIALDNVREPIRSQLQRDKAAETVKLEGEAMLAELESGKDLATLAAAKELEVKTVDSLTRSDAKEDRMLVAEAFRAPRRNDNQPSVTGFTLRNGDYIVMAVSGIEDGVVDGFNEADKMAFRRNMTQLLGRAEMQALLASLKARAEIDLNLEAVL